MPRSSIGVRTTDGTTGAAALEIISAANGKGIYLREVGISLATAVASTVGLGKPAAKGITPTTPATLLETDGSSISVAASTALAWGTGPTAPTKFVRRLTLPAVIGSFLVWTFEKGLFIPAGSTLVLWNLAANGVFDVSIVVDE